jgi:hypothetical protein
MRSLASLHPARVYGSGGTSNLVIMILGVVSIADYCLDIPIQIDNLTCRKT